MRLRVPFALTALVLLGAATARPCAGQVLIAGSTGTAETDLTPQQEQDLLGEYWSIAKKYLTADAAKAIKDMSAWTRDRVGKVQSIQYQPEQASSLILENRAEWNPKILRGAAMLHTDIALAAFRQGDIQTFEYQVGFADGWFVLADNRQSAPGSLRARWNVAVSRMLLANGSVGLADRHLARMIERITDDAGLLLAYGTVKENQASAQMVARLDSKPADPDPVRDARDAALTLAASAYTRALAADATLTEARVRLAHVHIMRGDDAQADPLLTKARADQPTPTMKYLASLMLGGIRERQGKLNDAAHLYVEAVQAVPAAQSAYIALAHVMHTANQRSDAATVLDKLFTGDVSHPAADPWWTYALGLDGTYEAQFAAFRAEIRK